MMGSIINLPFLDLDADEIETEGLIQRVQASDHEGLSSARDCLRADDNPPVCCDVDDERWNNDFLDGIGQRNKTDCMESDTNVEVEDEVYDLPHSPPPPKFKTFTQPIMSIEVVCYMYFLQDNGHTNEANEASDSI